jgi:hypothetical protein
MLIEGRCRNEFHVFGHASTLSQIQKKAFVGDARSFAFQKLGIVTEPWFGFE